MRLRIAEIGEDAVAHVFGDKPAEPGQNRGDGLMVGGDDGAQIFRVEPRRQLGRAGQVAEQDGKLTPLSLGGNRRRGRSRGRRRLLPERGDRIEEPPAVADQRHPEILQILGGQTGQNARVNLIVAERRGVLPKPESAQPIADIHRAIVAPFAASCYPAASAAAQPRNAGSLWVTT